MPRRSAVASLLAGAGLLAFAAAALILDLGGRDASEAIGAPALFVGLFLTAEGGLVLWRQARLARLQQRGNP